MMSPRDQIRFGLRYVLDEVLHFGFAIFVILFGFGVAVLLRFLTGITDQYRLGMLALPLTIGALYALRRYNDAHGWCNDGGFALKWIRITLLTVTPTCLLCFLLATVAPVATQSMSRAAPGSSAAPPTQTTVAPAAEPETSAGEPLKPEPVRVR